MWLASSCFLSDEREVNPSESFAPCFSSMYPPHPRQNNIPPFKACQKTRKFEMQVSPAESRDMNRPCLLLDFYDRWVKFNDSGDDDGEWWVKVYSHQRRQEMLIGDPKTTTCVKARRLAFSWGRGTLLCIHVPPDHWRRYQIQAEIRYKSVLIVWNKISKI